VRQGVINLLVTLFAVWCGHVVTGQQEPQTFTDFYYMNSSINSSEKPSENHNTTIVAVSSTTSQPSTTESVKQTISVTSTEAQNNQSKLDVTVAAYNASTAQPLKNNDVSSTTRPTTVTVVNVTEAAPLPLSKTSDENRVIKDKGQRLEYNVSDDDMAEMPDDWRTELNITWPDDIRLLPEHGDDLEDLEDLDEPHEAVIMDYYPVQNIFKQYEYVLAIIIPIGVGIALALPALVLCLVYNWAPRRRRKVVGDKQYVGQQNDKWTLLVSDSDDEA
jgi:hypothetical protein